MRQTVVFLLGTAIIAGAGVTAFTLQRRSRSRARLWGRDENRSTRPDSGQLAGWLSRAGIRGESAAIRFVVACVGSVGVALAMALILGQSPALLSAANGLAGPSPWISGTVTTRGPVGGSPPPDESGRQSATLLKVD